MQIGGMEKKYGRQNCAADLRLQTASTLLNSQGRLVMNPVWNVRGVHGFSSLSLSNGLVRAAQVNPTQEDSNSAQSPDRSLGNATSQLEF